MSNPRPTEIACLLLAAAAAGAAVMAVELLGARMLGAGFGGSLTVWGAMIAVTLIALAVGYFIGGCLADRYPSSGRVAMILLASSVLIAACPHLRGVLRASHEALGIRWGALAGSALIFFLPLGLLGMVSPFAIKLLSGRGEGIGFAAGSVYAVATLGSAVGTLLTAFWLIPAFGIAMSFRAVAMVVAAAGAAAWIASAGRRAGVTIAVPLLLAVVPVGGLRPGERYTAPDGARVTVEAACDSWHGRIAVLRKGAYRLLVVDGIVQTGMPVGPARMEKGQGLLDCYWQELIPYTVNDPDQSSALLIGLAGGMTASILAEYGMAVDCVDLDPAVVATAREWFGFAGNAAVADGRQFLERCRKRYDVCVLDVYAGDALPLHLTSREAFQAAQGVLKPGGRLVVNFIGAPAGRAFACLYSTLLDVFPNVLAVKSEIGGDVQSITVFAGELPVEFNGGWVRHLEDGPGVDAIRDSLARLTVQAPNGGFVLTDDHNPLDYLRAGESVRWRERTIANIGKAAMF